MEQQKQIAQSLILDIVGEIQLLAQVIVVEKEEGLTDRRKAAIRTVSASCALRKLYVFKKSSLPWAPTHVFSFSWPHA